MQTNQNAVIWTVVVATIILLVVGIIGFTSMPSKDSVNDQIQSAIDGLDIPTASEIAALIQVPEADVQEMPDTFYSVNDEKKALAYDLVLEEMEDKDFLKDVMNKINADITNDIDSYKDIKLVVKYFDEKETEVRLIGHGSDKEKAKVTLEFNAYYLEDSDEEECGKARLQVVFTVNDLDRDNDYEDAEAGSYSLIVEDYSNEVRDRYCEVFA